MRAPKPFVRVVSRIAVPLGMVVGLLVAAPAHAAPIITLSFSGTYDTEGTTVFGLSGAAVPYHYELTYDTALDTNTLFFATGDPLGAETTTHDWYGYSASGIIATSLTFGTQTWNKTDLQPREPAPGVIADLWFDTDIALSTPTRSLILFDGGSSGFGTVVIGLVEAAGSNVFMTPGFSRIDDHVEGGSGRSSVMTIERTVAPVPEPSTLALLGVGGAVMARRRARRRAA